MRRLLTGLLVLVTSLVLPLAMVSTWLAAIVTDTGSYVSTVAPLADDSDVQRAVEQRLEDLALNTTAPGTVSLASVPGARQIVHRAAVRAVEGPEFPPVWKAANRAAHKQFVAAMEEDGDGRVVIELGSLYTVLLAGLGTQGLLDPSAVPPVQVSFVVMDESDLTEARAAYAALDAMGLWLPLVWLVLLVITLIAAPSKRGTLAWLSFCSLVTLGGLALLLGIARTLLLDQVPDADADLAGARWGGGLAGLWNGILVAAVIALALLAVCWFARRVGGRRPAQTAA